MLDKAQDEHIFNGTFFELFPGFAPYHATMSALPTMLTLEQRKAQGFFNGWRAKLGGAGEDMYRKYKKLDQ